MRSRLELRTFLERLYLRYHRKDFLYSDPLEFVHRYSDPFDQEAVALFSSVLAYGNVKQIRKSVGDGLSRMENRSGGPSGFVRDLKKSRARLAFDGFFHRFNTGEDIVLLFELLGESWKRYGSLGAHLMHYHRVDAPDFGESLSSLISEWRTWEPYSRSKGYFSYLLTSPKDGSCCKRWCMLLRWMGRKDELDPGLWMDKGALAQTFRNKGGLKSSQLIMPLDTHIGRISQYLGLTKRKTMDWKAAVEITQNLKSCSPEDPTKYDFAMARLGILDLCQRKYREEICEHCDLLSVCRFAQSSRACEVNA